MIATDPNYPEDGRDYSPDEIWPELAQTSPLLVKDLGEGKGNKSSDGQQLKQLNRGKK